MIIRMPKAETRLTLEIKRGVIVTNPYIPKAICPGILGKSLIY